MCIWMCGPRSLHPVNHGFGGVWQGLYHPIYIYIEIWRVKNIIHIYIYVLYFSISSPYMEIPIYIYIYIYTYLYYILDIPRINANFNTLK